MAKQLLILLGEVTVIIDGDDVEVGKERSCGIVKARVDEDHDSRNANDRWRLLVDKNIVGNGINV